MTLTVFCILLFAALLHASWNAIVKASGDKMYAAIGVSGSAALIALVLLPFVIFQDLEDLEEAVREINPELRHFETSVFNGHYVTSDVDQGYLDHLNALRSDDNKAVREWQEGTSNLEIFNEGS